VTKFVPQRQQPPDRKARQWRDQQRSRKLERREYALATALMFEQASFAII
jgi:hypothetical protein